jgi:predicted helicase
MISGFDEYLLALRKIPLEDQTEHTARAALEGLLNEFAKAAGTGIVVQHEPKRVAGKGAPDFKVTKGGLILGYVENKGIGEPLDKILKSEQIVKYKTLSQNIVLTDYLHFIWVNKDGIQRETLCHPTDLENTKFRIREDRAAAVARLLQGFFSAAPERIGRSQALALALASRARLLRDYLGEELVRQERGEHNEERLYGLFEIFRRQVFQELTLSEFADAFAQMLAYGLFLAGLNANSEPVTLHNAREYVPGSFRLIRELVDFLTELEKKEYRDVRWVVEEVLSIVNSLDLRSIQEDLSFRRRKAISRKVRATSEDEHRLFELDPFIYFYEGFLKAYDPDVRERRGVYYTPPPIVNFIVRAVDDILKESFGIQDGLANPKRVTVLDFACGTGTFLLEVFQRIFDNIGGADSGRADPTVREHILTHLYGFEYLIAPYTIAHLKLSQFLRGRGHPLEGDERLLVYLTNTLEPVEPIVNRLLPELTAETRAAQNVKEMPILVITGNPPYSGHSMNKGRWITTAIEEYKFTWEATVDGLQERKPLGERNPKWLQDDYVKFLRFAQMKMDGFTFRTSAPDGKTIEHSVPGVENGIVAVITNHSWLDNPTFRGMRQSLMRTFDQIFVLDLHGSVKKTEHAPDGSKDENVFDIQQGVAISLFVKKAGLERGVWRGDLWGSRLDKYRAAAATTVKGIDWTHLDPVTPFYLFAWQNAVIRNEYEGYWGITEIFPISVLGFQTHRDAFAVSFTEAEMDRKLDDLASSRISDDELARQYGLTSNRDWSLPNARSAMRAGAATPPQLVAYRPFDERWSEFSGVTMDYPRRELLAHVAGRQNLSLLVPRGIGTQAWRHAFVTDKPANDCVISNRSREANQVFPLWRFSPDGKRYENLSPHFRAYIDARYERHYTAQEIFGAIYAILHAPSYRSRYSDFLRIDFPRVPLPNAEDDFELLSGLGWALVQAHLLREVPRATLASYEGQGGHTVEAVRYSQDQKAIWINKTQFFRPVPQAVWDFHIGGYQVIDKYLKSRKGRKLSLDEINHVSAIANSLAFTIEQMATIDDAYRAAFPDRG